MAETTPAPIITAFDWVPDFARGLVRDLRVRWAFEEIGKPYRTQLFGAATPRPDDYLAWQPFDQVPAFADGELRFFESGAILLYLAEEEEQLLPADPQMRWNAISWLFAALNSVEPAFTPIVSFDVFQSDQPWARDAREPAAKLARQKLLRVNDALGDNEWLAGDFSIADIAMVTVLNVLRHTDMVAEFPRLAAYRQRGESRSAYRRALDAQLADFTAEAPNWGE
ncbi:glutathione S-transferase [Altererythrobacter atlanticus]|uniref:Glutathione S-transferase GstA n=1 Tax=Croceibacterium atlanticum TaxID=1267766 RepID=A0A0F7KR38_9SPHN|nr:glutathione S-transferase family protein [Croceibacterium atlanticum]AKH42064.1 Glutathione S-transferase GstA [Croceibacterium atlanticum]MBB5733367.1 glutathione S-transferase [Croceibacterium atlanticum]